MKVLQTLALAALLGGAAALATAADTGTSSSTPAATTTAKPMSSKECNKAADEKKLTGDARAQFVKDCHAGKAPTK